MSENVDIDVTVDQNYISNYLSATQPKVPLYTSLNMNFIDEVNFDSDTEYNLLTIGEEICHI